MGASGPDRELAVAPARRVNPPTLIAVLVRSEASSSTSWPACASSTPSMPPTAPAPRIAIRSATSAPPPSWPHPAGPNAALRLPRQLGVLVTWLVCQVCSCWSGTAPAQAGLDAFAVVPAGDVGEQGVLGLRAGTRLSWRGRRARP